MGIKRLYKYLRFAFDESHLGQFRKKKVGIDAMGWLYRAFFGQGYSDQEQKIYMVRKFEQRIRQLEQHEIQVS